MKWHATFFMTFQSTEDVIAFIKSHQTIDEWVKTARKNHKTLKALVTGDGFHEELIERIEKIESADRAVARKKYSKDIRDMFIRVMQPRLSIFSSYGGSVTNEITSEKTKERLDKHLTNFKGQKSIKKYLSENFFRLEDTDPNGLIFVEYISDENIYPTYKSIKDIRWYESNGQMCESLLFEPKTVMIGSVQYQKWRVVDDEWEYCVLQNGDIWMIDEEKTFRHPFGNVPAIILSDVQITGSEVRVSPIWSIEELSKDYARDKSIKTIYKFQNGFPRHWRYEKPCRTCHGVGKTGEDICATCDGTGHLRVSDVTDTTIVSFPREDEPIVTPNLEGFIAPDLETWQRYTDDLKETESLIESTMWGTHRIQEGGNETATGRFIDIQPVINRLDSFTDNVEWVHNKLINWVENWVNASPKEDQEYKIIYGRRFIIESPDVVLDKYSKAKSDGDNNTILDKLLNEFIMSKYQNDPQMLAESEKKIKVEPYIHNSIKEVFDIFGKDEAEKKVLFQKFWIDADKSKDVDQLNKDFDDYILDNTVKTEEQQSNQQNNIENE